MNSLREESVAKTKQTRPDAAEPTVRLACLPASVPADPDGLNIGTAPGVSNEPSRVDKPSPRTGSGQDPGASEFFRKRDLLPRCSALLCSPRCRTALHGSLLRRGPSTVGSAAARHSRGPFPRSRRDARTTYSEESLERIKGRPVYLRRTGKRKFLRETWTGKLIASRPDMNEWTRESVALSFPLRNFARVSGRRPSHPRHFISL